jgi:hypothetical protein
VRVMRDKGVSWKAGYKIVDVFADKIVDVFADKIARHFVEMHAMMLLIAASSR